MNTAELAMDDLDQFLNPAIQKRQCRCERGSRCEAEVEGHTPSQPMPLSLLTPLLGNS